MLPASLRPSYSGTPLLPLVKGVTALTSDRASLVLEPGAPEVQCSSTTMGDRDPARLLPRVHIRGELETKPGPSDV